MKDYTDIIIAPVITEKSASQAEANVYTFKVASSANKIEIKKAIEAAYAIMADEINCYDIVNANKLVCDEEAVKVIEGGLK